CVAILDLDLGTAHGVAHRLFALGDILVDVDFLDHARTLAHDRLLARFAHLDRPLLESVVAGLERAIDRPALDAHALLPQVHRLLGGPLDHIGVAAHGALVHGALADDQLLLRHRQDILGARACRHALADPAAPAFTPPLRRALVDVDRAMGAHHVRGAI